MDVSLAASTTLSLSGNRQFNFSTTFTSHASQPLTALALRGDAISFNSDIELLDATTRKRVAPDLIDVYDERLFEREDFLRLQPEIPHNEKRSLSMKNGLEELRLGSEYILRFPNNEWRWWSFGSIDDAMRLGLGYLSGRGLGEEFRIHLVCHDEVRFRVVE